MCGILGYIGEKNTSLTEALAALSHRGPDNTGMYRDERIALGHCRLSIIDLSERANQPLKSSSGNSLIAFNGEIYNYKILRQELEGQGAVFHTHSDTEVILNGYEMHGIAFLNRLRGMWAFVLYDMKKQHVIFSRDPFGIKPLYYAYQDQTVYFASEIKALQKFPITLSPNTDAYFEFFNLGYFLAPATPYKNVYKLMAGEVLVWSVHPVEIIAREYLSPLPPQNQNREIASDPISALDAALTETVEAHYVADTSVAILLSGGSDSSLIAALSKKLGKSPTAYHVAIPGSSDTYYAEKVAEELTLPFSKEILSEELLAGQYEKIWDVLDEPTGDISIIPTTLIFQRIKGRSKVVLSGEGGDELFGGYTRHSLLKKHAVVSEKNLLNSICNALLSTSNGAIKVWNPLVQRMKRGLLAHGIPHDVIGAYLASVKLMDFPFQDEAIRRRLFHLYEATEQKLVPPALFFDMFAYLPNDLLPKSDVASMASSIEARVPLVDKILLETVLPILDNLSMRDDRYDKRILKQVLKNYLPHELVYRDKKGFGVPLRVFEKTRFKDDFHEAASFHVLHQDMFAFPKSLCSILENHSSRSLVFKKYPRFAFALVSNWKLFHT